MNNNREQIVRLYIKDGNSNVIDSRDIKILKTYIEETVSSTSGGEEPLPFDPPTGVSEEIKLIFERIYEIVSGFPQESKLIGMDYIKRLKEEFGDDREKTNIIMEFEGFIMELNTLYESELVDLLESLIGPNETPKDVAFSALKNLTPLSIACVNESKLEITGELDTCYKLIVFKLEAIYESSNIDENIVIGKSILKNIEKDDVMTNEEKINYKALLQVLVYDSYNPSVKLESD
ncbi:MAG: hypothetical protein LBU14_01975 [Candidatus Peribacteria bacterium]|nr:hypothetical protein [Candidatus Peribacteria bacterium]